MILWGRTFQTIRPMDSLPRLQSVVSEQKVDGTYHHEGSRRSRERHCIFKYTLSGEGRFRDAGGEHRVPRGSGFLVKISDPQTAYYYPEDGTEPWVFVYASFEGDVVDLLIPDMVRRLGPVFSLPESSEPIRRMLEIRGWSEERFVITAPWGARFVSDLLWSLVESKDQPEQADPGQELVRRVRQEVLDHLQENLTATQLAVRLSLSREYLARRFKEETGLSPHQFIIRQKMLAACRLLKESNLNCKEICAWLGYEEPAHFARTFRRVMGMTPSLFRRDGHIPPQ